jgi:ABC-type multidrug transport system fused ATPase/permease subunit
MIKEKQPIGKLLGKLWRHVGRKRRFQFCFLFFLMILSSIAEILNIGAVIPFLGVLMSPEKIYNVSQFRPAIDFFKIESSAELLVPIILLFGLIIVITNVLRFAVIVCSTRISASVGADLSLNVYRRTLYQPYLAHISRNSSEVINVITGKINLAVLTITMTINLIGAFIMLSAILIAVILIEPYAALIAFGGFGFIYFIIIQLGKSKLNRNSERIALQSTRVLKVLQEGLGGIRDVLLSGTQEVYCNIFHEADISARRAQGNIEIISHSPRYGVETLGLLLILTLSYFLASRTEGIGSAIAILAALALGAQRMLPVLQLAYGSWSGIRGNKTSLQDALDMLDQPMPSVTSIDATKPIEFNTSIILEAVGFRYTANSAWVLQNIDLVIPRGSRIGFIGRTGGGKSTLLDLIMGLLVANKGDMKIDGIKIDNSNCRNWQKHIAHVPQTIYLSDSTIAENIAFGVPTKEIDFQKVRKCAESAQISELIEGWPQRYQTHVGERGIRLSGGQRQRIGIARALYKNADVIVFDEATSALDSQTESAVIKAVEGLGQGITILMIAHRTSTLKFCDRVIEIDNGVIKADGPYHEVVFDN